MIVMVLMLIRCARHVFVLVRARLAGHDRWGNRVRDGGARQKCQRAQQQQKFRRPPPHAVKASAAGGSGQGQLYPKRLKKGRVVQVFICWRKHYCVSLWIDANPNRN